MTAVYRTPLRSRRDDVPPAVDRALEAGVVGMGGDASDGRVERRVARFAAADTGSYVWARRGDDYLLGRVTGPLREDTSPQALAVDLTYVRDCAWLPDPVEAWLVPEAVRATYARGGRNLQRIHDPAVEGETVRAWELSTA